MQQNDTQPQFDDVDEFAHVFDSTLPEDEWKIRLPRELGLEARERARHDGITLTELTRRALLSDDSKDQLKNRTHFYPKQCESNRNIPTKRMRSVVYAL